VEEMVELVNLEDQVAEEHKMVEAEVETLEAIVHLKEILAVITEMLVQVLFLHLKQENLVAEVAEAPLDRVELEWAVELALELKLLHVQLTETMQHPVVQDIMLVVVLESDVMHQALEAAEHVGVIQVQLIVDKQILVAVEKVTVDLEHQV
jgi:hypothetical protein